MPRITFILPDLTQKTVDVAPHISVLEAAQQNGLPNMQGICGGSMACATCHIYIHPDWTARVSKEGSEQSEEEIDTLDMAFHVTPQSRLGCQVEITDALDGLIVMLPPDPAR